MSWILDWTVCYKLCYQRLVLFPNGNWLIHLICTAGMVYICISRITPYEEDLNPYFHLSLSGMLLKLPSWEFVTRLSEFEKTLKSPKITGHLLFHPYYHKLYTQLTFSRPWKKLRTWHASSLKTEIKINTRKRLNKLSWI